jgi:hypothetical protein
MLGAMGGGRFMGSVLPLGGVSARASVLAAAILAAAETPVSSGWDVAIEMKDTAPCKDFFFFSSSPMRHWGQ